MLDSYILLQVKNLRNVISYLMEIGFIDNHDITIGDLDSLDFYLYELEKVLT